MKTLADLIQQYEKERERLREEISFAKSRNRGIEEIEYRAELKRLEIILADLRDLQSSEQSEAERLKSELEKERQETIDALTEARSHEEVLTLYKSALKQAVDAMNGSAARLRVVLCEQGTDCYGPKDAPSALENIRAIAAANATAKPLL